MSEMNTDDERSKVQEIIDTAKWAIGDTEDMLVEFDQLAAKRRPDPNVEIRYAELRALLAERLKSEGPRAYVDDRGLKRISYSVYPEKLTMSADMLTQLHTNGVLSDAQFESVMPRVPNADALKRLITQGALTPGQIRSVASYVPGTPRIYWVDLEGGESE